MDEFYSVDKDSAESDSEEKRIKIISIQEEEEDANDKGRSVKDDVNVSEAKSTSDLKYIINFTGNNYQFVKSVVYHFASELQNVKKNSAVLCEPLEEFAGRLAESINNGKISDIESLTSKAAETLNVKYKMLQDSLEALEKDVKYLIINGTLNAEEIIMIQEKYGIEPIVIEIFDPNRTVEQIQPKSIRSSLKLNVTKQEDLLILYHSLVDYLFKALNINADYKNIPQNHRAHTVSEFDRLKLCSPLLFYGCFKEVFPKDSTTPIYMPKSPYELEESINSESEESDNPDYESDDL